MRVREKVVVGLLVIAEALDGIRGKLVLAAVRILPPESLTVVEAESMFDRLLSLQVGSYYLSRLRNRT